MSGDVYTMMIQIVADDLNTADDAFLIAQDQMNEIDGVSEYVATMIAGRRISDEEFRQGESFDKAVEADAILKGITNADQA